MRPVAQAQAKLCTGYGVKTMPGVREAIEQGCSQEADQEAAKIGEALAKAAGVIDRAAQALGGP